MSIEQSPRPGEHQLSAGDRRPDIQGLRALAVLVVVVFHSGLPMSGGFVGVDIFFVVSGFVITAMLDRQWRHSGQIKFGNFYMRRFKRLTPALAFMIVVTMVLSAVFVSPLGPQQAAGKTAIGAMLLLGNLVIASTTGGYFDARADTNPLLHTWSLSVEEQFYLVFPALLVFGWALARSRRRFLAISPFLVVASVGSLSFVLAVAGSYGLSVPGFRRILGFYSPATRAWEFAAGALLALMLARRGPLGTRLSQFLGIAGLALLAVSVLIIGEETPFPGTWTLLPVSGTLLVILAGTSASGPAFKILASRPMVRVGDWSYSIYLWHWPFIVFAGIVWPRNTIALASAAVLSLVPAIASYRWVEGPIRKLTRLAPRGWTGLVAAVLVIPILLGSTLWFSASRGWWSHSVRHLQAATIPLHAATVAGCDRRQPLSLATASRCTWNASASGSPIYLLGDSNSTQFSEGIIAAARDLERPVAIAAAVGCPFVDIFIETPPPSDGPVCRKYFDGTLDYLRQARHGVVVIANIDTYWGFSDVSAGDSLEAMSNNSIRKLAALEVGLRRTVETLSSAGHKVVLVQTIPHVKWDPSDCDLLVIVKGQCTAQTTLESALKPGSATRSVVANVAQALGVGVWDPVTPLCPAKICSTEAPSFVRYRDSAHISVPQSAALASDIRTIIASIGEPNP